MRQAKAFHCHVDPDSLTQGSLLIVGIIILRIGDIWFPAKYWTDFPVRLLGDWLAKLLRAKNKRRGFYLMFMDGPYEALVEPVAPPLWKVTAYERRLRGNIEVASADADLDDIETEIREAANRVLDEVARRGFADADVAFLRGILSST